MYIGHCSDFSIWIAIFLLTTQIQANSMADHRTAYAMTNRVHAIVTYWNIHRLSYGLPLSLCLDAQRSSPPFCCLHSALLRVDCCLKQTNKHEWFHRPSTHSLTHLFILILYQLICLCFVLGGMGQCGAVVWVNGGSTHLTLMFILFVDFRRASIGLAAELSNFSSRFD